MKVTEAEISERTFGCELEYEGIGQQKAANIVARVTGGTATWRGTHLNNWEVKMEDNRVWQVVSDGSLCGTSAEVVTPICRYADIEMIQEVVRALRKGGAKVNERTGLHVHVGAADFTPENLKNLVRTFYKNEKLILKAAGTLPRRIARYTRETDRAFIDRICNLRNPSMNDINVGWFGRLNLSPYHYDEHRYRALNLNNFWGANAKKTFEMRFWNGTTHAGELKSAILFGLLLAVRAKKAKASSARQRMLDPNNDRYNFRCFLIRIGGNGDLFKTMRHHLLKRLTGTSAWRRERLDARLAEAAANAEAVNAEIATEANG